MPLAAKSWVRTLLVCLLFCALGVSQTTSLHQHEHGDAHSCELCHSGHIPVIATPAAGHAAPSECMEWRAAAEIACRVAAAPTSQKSSRAPPGLFETSLV